MRYFFLFMDNRFFRSNVVYQIYPRSFCDSNGDGIGDIPGIISKLDYLEDLGVGIIWLSPVYKSPNADFGYDISDYYQINPEFGTLDDMDRLIIEARKRGIRIVMDLVVNHTSDEHPWFQKSKNVNSPFHNYYYWKKGKNNNTEPPNNWQSNFGGSAWEFDKDVGEWYLHLFDKKQVDLNWHNPDVVMEVERILRFWLSRGIYGFRCDVINQIWKEDFLDGDKSRMVVGQEHYINKDGNHKILERLHKDVFSHYDCMTVGETFDVDYENAKRFTAGNELDMCFHFDAMDIDKHSYPCFLKKYRPEALKNVLFGWQKAIDWNALYLENHDQRRSIERFGNGKKYWKESGKMLGMLLLTQRGTPFVYNGEEIGMLNLPKFSIDDCKDPVDFWAYGLMSKYHLPKRIKNKLLSNFARDHARTPFQWDDSKNAGFTKGDETWMKVNPNYPKINLAKEKEDPDSIFNFYKKAIALRKSNATLTYGSFEPIKTNKKIMAFYRIYQDEKLLVIMNMTRWKIHIPAFLRNSKGVVLLSTYRGAQYGYKEHLRPYEGLVVKL